MTSFGYRSNPRYAIKECSSCGTLYTRDCVCSIGTVEDKILVPKPPKTVYGVRDFQNSFEPSSASTNVVNAPREPYVVKQDNGSFVDKISFDLNRAPDSPNQFHCFHCKDVLRDGEAFTPTEPIDSLSMGDEHLNATPATESDESIKSCVENLVLNPSESEGENGCDVPAGFTTFSNVLFDDDYDSDSSDDQSTSDEDFPEKIYSNPLFDEEIIPMEIDQHTLNAESDLIESMPNHDSSVIISSKIDSLFDELLYHNSSPRPPEEIVSDNSNADIESFSPSHIPNLDSDSHMEEIDLSFNPDDPLPPPIEEDDDDSGRDVPILEELLDNYSLSLPNNESYHFDIPSPYRPPAKPPDGNT
nr:hypothetical protein [Tanacetum cinerariifolium]